MRGNVDEEELQSAMEAWSKLIRWAHRWGEEGCRGGSAEGETSRRP